MGTVCFHINVRVQAAFTLIQTFDLQFNIKSMEMKKKSDRRNVSWLLLVLALCGRVEVLQDAL